MTLIGSLRSRISFEVLTNPYMDISEISPSRFHLRPVVDTLATPPIGRSPAPLFDSYLMEGKIIVGASYGLQKSIKLYSSMKIMSALLPNSIDNLIKLETAPRV